MNLLQLDKQLLDRHPNCHQNISARICQGVDNHADVHYLNLVSSPFRSICVAAKPFEIVAIEFRIWLNACMWPTRGFSIYTALDASAEVAKAIEA